MLRHPVRREGGVQANGVLQLLELENPPIVLLSCDLSILIHFEEKAKQQIRGVWRLPGKEGRRRSLGQIPKLGSRGGME